MRSCKAPPPPPSSRPRCVLASADSRPGRPRCFLQCPPPPHLPPRFPHSPPCRRPPPFPHSPQFLHSPAPRTMTMSGHFNGEPPYLCAALRHEDTHIWTKVSTRTHICMQAPTNALYHKWRKTDFVHMHTCCKCMHICTHKCDPPSARYTQPLDTHTRARTHAHVDAQAVTTIVQCGACWLSAPRIISSIIGPRESLPLNCCSREGESGCSPAMLDPVLAQNCLKDPLHLPTPSYCPHCCSHAAGPTPNNSSSNKLRDLLQFLQGNRRRVDPGQRSKSPS